MGLWDLFRKPAENINKFCKKGDPLFIEGRLTFNSWIADDDSNHTKHRVTVEHFQLLGVANTGNTDQGKDTPVEDPAALENDSEDMPF